MYRYLNMAQEEEALIFNLQVGDLKQIYWCLTTLNNKEPIENLTSYKGASAFDEFKYLYINQERIKQIVDEICTAESMGLDIKFLDFNQFKHYVESNKTLSDINLENQR